MTTGSGRQRGCGWLQHGRADCAVLSERKAGSSIDVCASGGCSDRQVFIATPNFGTPVAALAFGVSVQTDELSSGSNFLLDLNTWSQTHDDLRGVDAIAMAGTGGTGLATTPGFDDGLVALSSGSLAFYQPARTRILPLYYVASPGLLTQTCFCPLTRKELPGCWLRRTTTRESFRRF